MDSYDAGDPTAWRPAVINMNVHDFSNPPENWEVYPQLWKADRKTLRLRPALVNEKQLLAARCAGCDAEQFYEVHPEDAKKILPAPPPGVRNLWVLCSHMIVAD